MALDPTKVTGKSTALITKRTEAFEDAAADLNLAVLRIDETCSDPDEANQRVKIAKAVLRGDDMQLRSELFGGLDPEKQRLIQQVSSGQLTQAQLDQMRQQAAQPRQAPQAPAPQPQPQVVPSNIVTPSQELTDAVNEAARNATSAANTAEEAKNLLKALEDAIEDATMMPGNKKEIKKQFTALKSKVEAAASAATSAKTKAAEAKNHASQAGSGNSAPATTAIPAANNP